MKYCESLSIESCDEGYKVTCCYKEKSEMSGEFTPMSYERKEFVYSEDDYQAAVDKFIEIHKEKNGEED